MSVFDYFEMDDRPVVVDRSQNIAWEWSRGQWRDASEAIDKSYAHGLVLEVDSFVQKYPYAALELLAASKAPSQR
jgi:hypothetical protein